ncbi:MAG: UDP-glucose 4-epimerase [Pseudomonas sp. PGPPP3]|nr:MAG: UDP-glucose 4-epimerase [Pseudomonas sp. PGPPP3]
MNVLVTGGAGYIGSHTVLELLRAGHDVVVLDNLCNSAPQALQRVQQLAGRALEFCEGDIRDKALLDQLFRTRRIEAVLHFAGLKAVGESMSNPMQYYANNFVGTLTLCQAMAEAGVFSLVFSSSATVYGEPSCMPISESCPTSGAANPYGRSKLMVEQLLQDLQRSDPRWSIALLRYFNPVGAHASGQLERLTVHGSDYPTADGTCIRDYIHVLDLALGHLRALEFIARKTGCHIWNLGTGKGYSVLEVIHAFEQVCGVRLRHTLGPRRAGDVAASWADPSKAARELGWKAERGLDEMMSDTWRWQSLNPQGYR